MGAGERPETGNLCHSREPRAMTALGLLQPFKPELLEVGVGVEKVLPTADYVYVRPLSQQLFRLHYFGCF